MGEMKHKRVAATAVVSVLLTVGQMMPAFAWGPGGHQQIADIAWVGLSTRARSQIRAILKASDPQFQPQTSSVSSLRDAFRLSATMPDVIKGNRRTVFEPMIAQHENDFGALTDPLVSDNEKPRCKSFHYFDTPINSQGGAPLDSSGHTPQVARSNASAAFQLATRRLREIQAKPTLTLQDRREQAWWLSWIEHIVGDLHQPLHCAQDFGINRDGDAGGNLFKITDPQSGGSSNLHSLWDGAIDRVKLQESNTGGLSSRFTSVSTRWLRDENIAQSSSEARTLDEKKWIADGAALAKKDVYPGIVQLGAPLNSYLMNQARVVKRQAVLGGLRLTNLLNDILGG